MSQQLIGVTQRREDVPVDEVNSYYQLFSQYYRKVDWDVFLDDWLEKEWVITLKDREGVLRGFTTLMLYEMEFKGEPLRAVFSGNTIIEKEFWGEQVLARSWGDFMADRKLEKPEIPLYWFLISSGFRTYLFLPIFFKNFYPSVKQGTPQYEQELIDCLGRMKFPDEYKEGVVRVHKERECLRKDLTQAHRSRKMIEHIQFFQDKNPGHLRGDELVCLAEFSFENNKRLAQTCLNEKKAQLCSFVN